MTDKDTKAEKTEAAAVEPQEAAVEATPETDALGREHVATSTPASSDGPGPLVQKVEGTVPAVPKATPRPADPTLPFSQVSVDSDTPITDPNHPLAVQPGPSGLPLTPIAEGSGEKPETVFARS